MKTSLQTGLASLLFSLWGTHAIAGCESVCLSLDSLGGTHAMGLPEDTAYLPAGGSVKIFAKYNGACFQILSSSYPQMELVFYKDGLPYDTTSLADATYDNIWTYYTTFYAYEPGLYEVYFIGYYQPGYACQPIRILQGEQPQSNSGMATGIDPASTGLPDFVIYPNPSSQDIVNIKNSYPAGISRVELFETTGTKILDILPQTGTTISINTTGFSKGMYLVRIYYQNQVITRRLVVN